MQWCYHFSTEKETEQLIKIASKYVPISKQWWQCGVRISVLRVRCVFFVFTNVFDVYVVGYKPIAACNHCIWGFLFCAIQMCSLLLLLLLLLLLVYNRLQKLDRYHFPAKRSRLTALLKHCDAPHPVTLTQNRLLQPHRLLARQWSTEYKRTTNYDQTSRPVVVGRCWTRSGEWALSFEKWTLLYCKICIVRQNFELNFVRYSFNFFPTIHVFWGILVTLSTDLVINLSPRFMNSFSTD